MSGKHAEILPDKKVNGMYFVAVIILTGMLVTI